MNDPNLLILGGSSEARALAEAVFAMKIRAVISLAGRVEHPVSTALTQRIGGFGGSQGLADWIVAHQITHVVDATHPFAVHMSKNAIFACAQTKTPLIALKRAPWQAQAGDDWRNVPNIKAAAHVLCQMPRQRVMLAIGRMHLTTFAVAPQHFYLLRLIDALQECVSFPDHHVILERGPFNEESDLALLREHKINLIVSKNAGGTASHPKLVAARRLGIPVVMIDRPALFAERYEVGTVNQVVRWIEISHSP